MQRVVHQAVLGIDPVRQIGKQQDRLPRRQLVQHFAKIAAQAAAACVLEQVHAMILPPAGGPAHGV